MANKYAPRAAQDVPPKGGFEKFDWLGKGVPRRGPSGWKALAVVMGVSVIGFTNYVLTFREHRLRQFQKRNQNYEMFPLLYLEQQLFRLQAQDFIAAEEKRIMANVPDWEERKKVYHEDDGHARRDPLPFPRASTTFH